MISHLLTSQPLQKPGLPIRNFYVINAIAKAKTDQLIISKSQNAKEYWKLLKQAANLKTKCSIDAKRFSEYFKAISDQNDRFYQLDEDILYFSERYAQGELQVMFEELNLPISIGEIKRALVN